MGNIYLGLISGALAILFMILEAIYIVEYRMASSTHQYVHLEQFLLRFC